MAISLVLNAKKGISARQLSRDLDVNKNTAWRMSIQIRKAMIEQGDLLRGIVAADECYIGGKPRKGNDPTGKTGEKRGRGTKNIPVVGVVERNGNVKAKVAKDLKSKSLARFI